jgi:signal transduction histidine kinase
MPPTTDYHFEPQEQLDHIKALHRIGLAMASTLSAHNIMQIVLNEVQTLTQASSATIFIMDSNTHLLVPRLSKDEPVERAPLDIMTGSDLAVQVAHTGHAAQLVTTRPPANGAAAVSTDPRAVHSECRLCLPLVAGDEVMGVIDVTSSACARFGHEMEELLVTIASQAALVLRNAKTHEDLEQHYRELSLLYEIQQEVSSTLEYQKVLALIVDRTRRLMEGAECTIRLVEDQGVRKIIRVAATTAQNVLGKSTMPLEDSLIDMQVLGGDLISVEDVRTDPRFTAREDAEEAGIVSMLCGPLTARRRVLGSIRLYTNERRDFDLSDRKMFLAIAGMAATAIDNARLYTQVDEKNKELVSTNKMLRSTQKQLVQKEKLAALGEMAATVAHEIRNPLTSVRGFAQRISRKYAGLGDGRLTEYTSIIIEEVDRLNKFIKDVLDFARRAKPEFKKVNVNIILSDIINLMRDELTAQSIVVVPDFDMNLPGIYADEVLLRQAFLNILQNSRQAMGKGGILMIRTQTFDQEVRLRIADDGHGIPRELLHKVWTPFYTTKTQGTGLGLSLVLRIIDDHHGKLLIRSRVGQGTVIDIRFPVISDPEELLLHMSSHPDNLPGKLTGE